MRDGYQEVIFRFMWSGEWLLRIEDEVGSSPVDMCVGNTWESVLDQLHKEPGDVARVFFNRMTGLASADAEMRQRREDLKMMVDRELDEFRLQVLEKMRRQEDDDAEK